MTGTLIEGNNIRAAGTVSTGFDGRGIWIEGSTGTDTVRRTIIRDNGIFETNGHGIIIVGDANNSLVAGNFVIDSSQQTHNTYDGIHIVVGGAKTPTDVVVQGNTIGTAGAANTHRYGINVASTGTRTMILDNTVFGAATAAYNAVDTNVIVRFSDVAAGRWERITDGTSAFVNVDSLGSLSVFKSTQPGTLTFSTLGTPGNGFMTFCSDCTIANPCAGSGTGAIAKRLNGVWVCN